MDQLPTEIVENIVRNSNLNIADVLNASATCKRLRSVIYNNNQVWKRIYLRIWPDLVPHLQDDEINWLQEHKHVHDIKLTVQEMLHTLAKKYYSAGDLGPSELVEWNQFAYPSRPVTYFIVVDYLMKLIWDYKEILTFQVVPLFTPGNNTLRYYCIKALQFLRHSKQSKEYEQFVQLDERERTMEQVATFIARWCQPLCEIKFKEIQEHLDLLAQAARRLLMRKHPRHPLIKVPKEVLLDWRARNLEAHQFDTHHCLQILTAINEVLYKWHNFTENRQDFYAVKNSYINHVLSRETGLPISLCIVYESVARRLGVNCEPVNVPSHFLLRFQRIGTGEKRGGVYYLNTCNGGALFAQGPCPYSASTANPRQQRPLMPRATSKDVMLRMAANLENVYRQSQLTSYNIMPLRSILELNVLIAPQNLLFVKNLAQCGMTLNMDMHFLLDIMNQTSSHPTPKRRPHGMQFAVGIVIRHKVLNYLGVIIDWTPVCTASRDWQTTMNVDSLQRKANQPFYNVFAEDGTNRYVAEENLVVSLEAGSLPYAGGKGEIGRHFSHFFENHFVPNREKENEYPEDHEVRWEIY